MEPNVNYVTACTWHWIFTNYHGLVSRCDGFVQKIPLPYQPQCEHGWVLLMWMQGVDLCQLGRMGEFPSTPKKGYGQYSYEGQCCSYVEHKEALIPCVWMFGVLNSKDMQNHPIDYLYLFIGLWVERT